MYNELIALIGERENKCLPFVNMCLRAWKIKLAEDIDLWANLDLLHFEEWIIEEIRHPQDRNRTGKTSYKLMMSIFGDRHTKNLGFHIGMRKCYLIIM